MDPISVLPLKKAALQRSNVGNEDIENPGVYTPCQVRLFLGMSKMDSTRE